MIKVLNIISDTNIGGAGRVLINYMKYYDASRFDVTIALPRGSALLEPLSALGAKIREVDGIADKSLDLKAIKELKTIIRETDPDIVHTHGSMSGRIAGRQCGRTVIYTRHSAFPVPEKLRKFPGKQLNKLINEHYADRIIAVSPATALNLTDSGISESLIDIMMNGVDPVERRSLEECAKFRRENSIGPADFVMGIVARVEDYKGHTDILDAMARIRDKHPDMKLLVAGTGAYEAEVKKKVQELHLSDNVIFLGFISDVSLVLSVLDVQLNASWGTEASSIAMLEGFSMGIPVVASDYGGNPWQVDDGVSGLLFKTRDVAGLADRLETLMDDRALLQKLGIGAKKQYDQRFTGEIFAARIEEIYTRTWEGRYEKGRH